MNREIQLILAASLPTLGMGLLTTWIINQQNKKIRKLAATGTILVDLMQRVVDLEIPEVLELVNRDMDFWLLVKDQ